MTDMRESANAHRLSFDIVPQLFFLALFPGLFVYHLLAATGIVPLVLGPGWSVVNGVAAVGLGFFLLREPKRHAPFLALVVVIVVYAGIYALVGENEWQRSKTMLLESGKLAVGLVSLYCIGFLLTDTEQFRRALLVALAFMAAATFVFIDPVTMTFIAIDRWDAPIGTAGYQWFAQSFSLTAIVALALTRDGRVQAVIIGVAVPTLFALFSRSEFLGFVIVVTAWCVVQGLRLQFRPIGLAAGSIAVGFAVLFVVASALPPVQQVGAERRHERERAYLEKYKLSPDKWWGKRYTAAERQAEAFNLSESGSFQMRMEFLREGWSDIVASPFVGDYGGQMRGGRFGDYIHNVLSVWRQYGLFAFLLYVGLCTWAAWLTFRQVILLGSKDHMWLFAFLITAYGCALIIATKSVFWPLPALAWGLVAARLPRRVDNTLIIHDA